VIGKKGGPLRQLYGPADETRALSIPVVAEAPVVQESGYQFCHGTWLDAGGPLLRSLANVDLLVSPRFRRPANGTGAPRFVQQCRAREQYPRLVCQHREWRARLEPRDALWLARGQLPEVDKTWKEKENMGRTS
jgi:hypothetical protein